MAEAEARITPYRNGPYLVRGPFTLVDQDGNEIEVKRRVVGAMPLRALADPALLRRHS